MNGDEYIKIVCKTNLYSDCFDIGFKLSTPANSLD